MQAQDDRVQRLIARYGSQAQAYEELWAPVLRAATQPLLRALRDAGVRRVLDVGAGVGALLPDLQARFPGALVVGVDRTPGMLRRADTAFPRAVMDATALGVASGSFDLVHCAFVLFHLVDPERGAAEGWRVLRAHGRMATITWGTEIESKASRLWGEELDRHGAPPLDTLDDVAQHDLVDTPKKMTTLLKRAGFRSLRAWEAPVQCRLDMEQLVRLRTRLGRHQRRFASLADMAQSTCLENARRRLASLAPEDFVSRGTVVYAVALK